MIVEGIDYNRTVETNKLVYKGQTFEKVTSYIIMLIPISMTLVLSYFIFKTQIENNPTKTDYFIAIFIPLLIMTLVGLFCFSIINRDKLKEFEIKESKSKAVEKILEAAKNLNWKSQVIAEHYLVFETKFEFVKDRQTVTLIIFPDNRIYFNSLNFLNDYLKPSRFDENYQELKTEYLKIENK